MTQPPRRPFVIFAVVAPVLLVASINSSIVAVGLPTMRADLSASLASIGWTITAYQLAQTVMIPLAGKLSDDWGRKRVFIAALILFTICTIAAGLSPNIGVLIGFRIIQGLAGAFFQPSATAIVSDAFGERRSTAVGLLSSVVPIGAILGPNLGGLILTHFAWRWIFFVNVPICLALIAGASAVLPNAAKNAQGKLDVTGAGLFAAGLTLLLYGLTNIANSAGALPWTVPLFLTLGAAFLGAFVWHESRVSAPFLKLALLRQPAFAAINTYNVVFGIASLSIPAFLPYYATVAFGLSPGKNGLALTPYSVFIILASLFSSLFLIKRGYRRPMVSGTLLIAAGLFLLSLGLKDVRIGAFAMPNATLLGLVFMVSGMGVGFSNPASNNAILDLAPGQIGAASGLRGMFRLSGGVIGTASIPLVLSRFGDEAVGMRYIFLGLGVILVLMVPLLYVVPDHARQRYLEKRQAVKT